MCSLLMDAFFIIFVAIYWRQPVDLSLCILMVPFVLISIIENRRQVRSWNGIQVQIIMMFAQALRLFIADEAKSNLLSENEALIMAQHAVEMRHMIANIAHDMKSVDA